MPRSGIGLNELLGKPPRGCELFASGQLSAGALAYTADALLMADRVEYSDPDIADDLALCTDPEINGPLTTEQALEIARRGGAA